MPAAAANRESGGNGIVQPSRSTAAVVGVAASQHGKGPWPYLVAENDNGKPTINQWNNQPVATDSAASVTKAVKSTVTTIFKK